MSEINLTVGENVDASGTTFGQVENHVRHDENQQHRNQNIDFALTKFNLEQHLNENGKWTKKDNHWWLKKEEKFVAPYVKKHDESLDDKHKYRAYGSPKKYLDKQQSHERRAVIVLGNQKMIKPLEEELKARFEVLKKGNHLRPEIDSFDKFRARYYNHVFSDYIDHYNKVHKHLQITDYVTNLDEAGAPHVHVRIVPMSHTKTGRPSFSFNAAVRLDQGLTARGGGQKAIVKYRDENDRTLLDVAQTWLTKLGSDVKLNLKRLPKSNNKMSIEEYQNYQKTLEQQEELKQEKEQLEKDKAELNKKVKSKQNSLNARMRTINKIKADNQKLKAENQALKTEISNVEKQNSHLTRVNRSKYAHNVLKRLVQDSMGIFAHTAYNVAYMQKYGHMSDNEIQNSMSPFEKEIMKIYNGFESETKRNLNQFEINEKYGYPEGSLLEENVKDPWDLVKIVYRGYQAKKALKDNEEQAYNLNKLVEKHIDDVERQKRYDKVVREIYAEHYEQQANKSNQRTRTKNNDDDFEL